MVKRNSAVLGINVRHLTMKHVARPAGRRLREIHLARIGKRWVGQEPSIGQGLEEADQIRLLLRCKTDLLDEFTLVRILRTVPGVWACLDRSSACEIVVDRILQGFYAPVVHVGRGHRDVAKGRRLELSDVFFAVRKRVQAEVRLRVGKRPSGCTDPVLWNSTSTNRLAEVVDSSSEIETTVAMEALQLFTEEQAFAALRRFRYRIGIVASPVAIVRRIPS